MQKAFFFQKSHAGKNRGENVTYYERTVEYLENYKPLQASIENMEKEIEELDYFAAKGICLEYTGRNGYKTSLTEDAAINIMERKEQLRRAIRRTKHNLDKIDRGLETLNEVEKYIIVARYFEGQQWWTIAYRLKYSERWCKELRRRAVKRISISLFGEKAIHKQFPNTSPNKEKSAI